MDLASHEVESASMRQTWRKHADACRTVPSECLHTFVAAESNTLALCSIVIMLNRCQSQQSTNRFETYYKCIHACCDQAACWCTSCKCASLIVLQGLSTRCINATSVLNLMHNGSLKYCVRTVQWTRLSAPMLSPYLRRLQ